MKRRFFGLFILLYVAFQVTACVDFYGDKRPQSNKNEYWKCEAPEAYFSIKISA